MTLWTAAAAVVVAVVVVGAAMSIRGLVVVPCLFTGLLQHLFPLLQQTACEVEERQLKVHHRANVFCCAAASAALWLHSSTLWVSPSSIVEHGMNCIYQKTHGKRGPLPLARNKQKPFWQPP